MKRFATLIMILSLLLSVLSPLWAIAEESVYVAENEASIPEASDSEPQAPPESSRASNETEQAANELLQGIVGNENLSDMEKALLIHDRLAMRCEYDYENYFNDTIPGSSYSSYGALVLGVAVCQGYTEAYSLLLDKVGIENRLCRSGELNHIWNLVEIEGLEYHVDVTWDDPLNGMAGHGNFLVSNERIYSNGHYSDDYITPAYSTLYDNYFWLNSNFEFCLAGDEIYYLENYQTIKRFRDTEVIFEIPKEHLGQINGFASDGKLLYYSSGADIYSIDPENPVPEFAYRPRLPEGATFIGFSHYGGKLVYEYYDHINGNAVKKKESVTLAGVPKFDFTATNGQAATQTLSASGGSDITGYYFSKDGVSEYISGASFTKTINRAGSYSVYALDKYGKRSATRTVEYNKLTLSLGGGSVPSSVLLVQRGTEVSLPTPTHPKNAKFHFWYNENNDYWSPENNKYTVDSNATLFSRWEEELRILTPPNKTLYYVGDEFDPTGFTALFIGEDGKMLTLNAGDLRVYGFFSGAADVSNVTFIYEYQSDLYGYSRQVFAEQEYTVKNPSLSFPHGNIIFIGVGETVDLKDIALIGPENARAEYTLYWNENASLSGTELTGVKAGECELYAELYSEYTYNKTYRIIVTPLKHRWDSGTVTKAATCSGEGTKRMTCLDCGATTDISYIDSEAHTFGEWVVTDKPTCNRTGIKERSCLHCSNGTEYIMLDFADHSYALESREAPTCSSGGCEYYRCSVCESREIKVLEPTGNHTPDREADCTQDVFCTVCHQLASEAPGHTPGAWVLVREATANIHGLKECYCTVCGRVADVQYLPLTKKEAPNYSRGDVNGNGKIDAGDYALVKRTVLKTYYLYGSRAEAADVNGNGKIDAADYALLKRHVLKTYDIFK